MYDINCRESGYAAIYNFIGEVKQSDSIAVNTFPTVINNPFFIVIFISSSLPICTLFL